MYHVAEVLRCAGVLGILVATMLGLSLCETTWKTQPRDISVKVLGYWHWFGSMTFVIFSASTFIALIGHFMISSMIH